MFRRSWSSLPKDPEFPHDLEKLGYHINEKDQIRSIDFPDREFHYFISKNDRVLDKQREAMDDCIRKELAPRFTALGLETTRLPTTAGPTDPHIPILTSTNLRTAKRILLYLGEQEQDLGILAYRICGQESLASGSCLDLVAAALRGEQQGAHTAVVLANPGQLIWHRRGHRAMTLKSWNALPQRHGVSGGKRIDDARSRVPGHEGVEQHISRVMEFVAESMCEGAVVDLIGIVEGGELGVRYLDAHWDDDDAAAAAAGGWRNRIRAICVGLNYIFRVPQEVTNPDFLSFWSKRARAYLIHPDPLDEPLHGRDPIGCNCFSSGEALFSECIAPRAYTKMLAFFDLVDSVPGYEEVELEVPADRGEDGGDVGGGGGGGGRMVQWVEGNVVRREPMVTFSMGEDGGRGEGTV